jgi:hypothetical protein
LFEVSFSSGEAKSLGKVVANEASKASRLTARLCVGDAGIFVGEVDCGIVFGIGLFKSDRIGENGCGVLRLLADS